MKETKSQPITKQMVWEAYKRVKSNRGSAGIDRVSLEDCEADLEDNLYKLWNRLASGSYFPPPVKEVEIPRAPSKTPSSRRVDI
jgi:retron-type reverse transcriptase